MTFIKDKLLLFIISLFVYLHLTDSFSIVPILYIVIVSGLNTYFDHLYLRCFSLFITILLFGIQKDLLYFSPLILYDIAENKESRLLYTLTAFCFMTTLAFNYYTLSELLPIFLMYSVSVYL